jgi:hypothetical protein
MIKILTGLIGEALFCSHSSLFSAMVAIGLSAGSRPGGLKIYFLQNPSHGKS